MNGKSPRTRFLVLVMNPHAQVDRCIVPERSEAFGKLGACAFAANYRKQVTGNCIKAKGPKTICKCS